MGGHPRPCGQPDRPARIACRGELLQLLLLLLLRLRLPLPLLFRQRTRAIVQQPVIGGDSSDFLKGRLPSPSLAT